MTPAVALTIAGSDSGGGAGLQADLATFAAFGVFGTSAVTAITAQNTLGVHGVSAVPATFVIAQIEAVLDDFPVEAVKTGMLADAAILAAVAELAAAGRLPRLVVDPVMISSSGDRLLDAAAEQLYVERLFSDALVVTPNLFEAETLLGRTLDDLADVRDAAVAIADQGARVVVVTGGHGLRDAPDEAIDVAYVDGVLHELRTPRVATTNDHGTGCALSAATAAGLARGWSPLDALWRAHTFVCAALRRGAGWELGSGRGPLGVLRGERMTRAASSDRGAC